MSVELDNIRIKELDITELPDINIAVTQLPKINVGLTELPDINLGVTTLPEIKIGLTELPDININPIELNTSSTLLSLSTVKTDSTVTTESTIKSDSQLNTDNKIELAVTELPQIDIQLGFRPVRVHIPINYKFGFTLFGYKIFEFNTCGEGMIIAEDFKTKATEHCE